MKYKGQLQYYGAKRLKKYKDQALLHPNFPQEHKDFLNALQYDERGYPRYQGYNAG